MGLSLGKKQNKQKTKNFQLLVYQGKVLVGGKQ